ncbi:MAG: glycoside hydrolase family 92 protein, partial [Hymenobacter sp.]
FIGATTSTDAAGIYHGLGKTFPGATTPYGMVQVSPNTITGGDNGSGYSYEHTSIEGFAFTQMSGIGWFGDLGNFLVMPGTGALKTAAGKMDMSTPGYRQRYDKKSEKATAGYYAVQLTDFNIKTETTVTPHCGMLRFTFPQNKTSRIQIDLARRVGGTSTSQYVKVVDDHTIQGWMKCTPDGGGWGNGDGHADYTIYFYAQFSKPLTDYGVWSANIKDGWSRKREDIEKPEYVAAIEQASMITKFTEVEGKHLGFFTNFSTTANEVVQMKAGISFVSMDGAKKNLNAEIKDWNFDGTRAKAKQLWNDALGKVTIDAKAPADRKAVFYTALYHTMIDPRMMQDVDGNYPGADGKTHSKAGFTKRTVFSGWDVFRSQMPLQTIINPTLVNDLVNSLVTMADESGKHYLERWELANAYTGCMIGNPAVSVLADAYAKGIRNYDVSKAYVYAVNTVEKFGNGDKGFTGEPFSVSNTLEYAYTDWCVGQLAKALSKNEDATKYNQRGMAYQNIFDKEKGWFRPKKNDGTWETWPTEGR